ncbi:Beta-glucan synthesis-associated [Mycena venus]|uniref:Beta-glucan synthesis-associated n=1 Tax=Mycena venus TaxID=2733690 RepID=A0A8H7CND2_9AGAR|nr:Beta-glucan synthesis-associated [Mycena venus]
MKVSSALVHVAPLATLLPPVKALVGSSWSITNVPCAGLTEITFPFDHRYYFMPQSAFVNSDVGYTNLQPRPDESGIPVLYGVFGSSFINGSTTTDENCFAGADGGPGVSCSVEWNGVYRRTYDLEVKYNGSSLWIGMADTVAGARVHIGSYTVPAEAGSIRDSQEGFVEWYPWNFDVPPNHCARLPYQKIIFGTLRSTHEGEVGTQGLAFEYGTVGEVGFQTQQVDGGVDNECGFRGQTGLFESAYY